ncbi:MAG TPA: hypothetical protein VK013_08130 [Myxococcaceae bacterium]|nr:hypothetical protein [Myxococcaceae bacterium]
MAAFKSPLLLQAAWVLVACAACRSPGGDRQEPALGQVQAMLSERDARLGGYDVSGRIVEGEHTGTFSFSFRPPQKVLGSISSPLKQTIAFDGETLFQRDDASGRVQSRSLAGAEPAAVSAQLHSVFGSFVIEGFRTPLLPRDAGVELHREGTEQQVTLTATARSPEGAVRVITRHRWPSMDFLEKRVEAPGAPVTGVRMEKERCEASLKLCVPSRWVHLVDGKVAATVTLDDIRLGSEVQAMDFTLTMPTAAEIP